MEPEIIEAVLKEILDEIKMIRQENAEKEKYTGELNSKIQSAEGKLQSIKQRLVVISESQLQLESVTQRMEKIIKELPRNIIHKKQILLFPEYGAREYYRIVFGRIFFWLTIFIATTYLFSLGRQFIVNWKEVKQKEIMIQYEGNYKNSGHKIHDKNWGTKNIHQDKNGLLHLSCSLYANGLFKFREFLYIDIPGQN